MRLQLHALAYNLGNFLRTLATPEPMSDWSLTTLKEKLIKDRCQGGEPGPLCYLPDGRGRHRTANVPRILRLIAELRPQPPPAPA